MKSKFATIDLCAVIHDLLELKSMRVVNVYDINSKTYLIKLQKPNDKAFILFESGIRIHRTNYEWPKSLFPSSFSMKFRKHINQKRLINVTQVGMDRIVDLQFGEDERTCHVIVELYDRGNIVLTDHEYVILNILRPRTDADSDVRFSVKEKYPMDHARQTAFLPQIDNILLFLKSGKDGELLKRALVKHIPFGSLMLDHCLMVVGFPPNAQIGVHIPKTEEGAGSILKALKLAENIAEEIKQTPCNGFIAYLQNTLQNGNVVDSYQEYYPYDFLQFRAEDSKFLVSQFSSFSEAVDKFYSSIESQKAEHKMVHVEKETTRRLENIRRDHEQRLKALEDVQTIQERRGEYVQYNRELVEKALLLMRTALASKSSWKQIADWLEQCAKSGVDAAKAIVKLDLPSNVMTMRLTNPYAHMQSDDEEEEIDAESRDEPLNVDIDIGLSADQNVRKYFGNRRTAMDKQQKTLAASNKALKSAQIQVKSKINQVHVKTNSIRTRKLFWFEKFYWFISSDGYLVVAGRDAQQNEMLVKRYLRPGDIYVHAEIQGAASVIIRNRVMGAGAEIPPPRTLNEAGTMAICYSNAWDAKVVISAWWVRHDQVSRTAPTGEYLPTGSFMIRGKKNFLPSSQLQLGFGLLFKLDDESVARRKEEQKTLASDPLLANEEEDEKDEDGEELVQSSDAEADNDEFPDVNEELYEGRKIQVDLRALKLDRHNSATSDVDNTDEEYSIINIGLPQADGRGLKKTETEKYLEAKAQQQNQRQTQTKNESEEAIKDPKSSAKGPLTKRQKHKLDKIRKKYKDQDDEEREIRMAILGSAGKKKEPEEPAKVPRKPMKNAENGEKIAKVTTEAADQIIQEQVDGDKTTGAQDGVKGEDGVEVENEKDQPEEEETEEKEDELQIIDSLTSLPVPDDSPLFVLGVCGPYSAMQKFKFKVKLTPGTGKRGKAVKMAYSLFLRDKTISQAERVLIKSLGTDDRVASCLPGKVRVLAPMLVNTKGKH